MTDTVEKIYSSPAACSSDYAKTDHSSSPSITIFSQITKGTPDGKVVDGSPLIPNEINTSIRLDSTDDSDIESIKSKSSISDVDLVALSLRLEKAQNELNFRESMVSSLRCDIKKAELNYFESRREWQEAEKHIIMCNDDIETLEEELNQIKHSIRRKISKLKTSDDETSPSKLTQSVMETFRDSQKNDAFMIQLLKEFRTGLYYHLKFDKMTVGTQIYPEDIPETKKLEPPAPVVSEPIASSSKTVTVKSTSPISKPVQKNHDHKKDDRRSRNEHRKHRKSDDDQQKRSGPSKVPKVPTAPIPIDDDSSDIEIIEVTKKSDVIEIVDLDEPESKNKGGGKHKGVPYKKRRGRPKKTGRNSNPPVPKKSISPKKGSDFKNCTEKTDKTKVTQDRKSASAPQEILDGVKRRSQDNPKDSNSVTQPATSQEKVKSRIEVPETSKRDDDTIRDTHEKTSKSLTTPNAKSKIDGELKSTTQHQVVSSSTESLDTTDDASHKTSKDNKKSGEKTSSKNKKDRRRETFFSSDEFSSGDDVKSSSGSSNLSISTMIRPIGSKKSDVA